VATNIHLMRGLQSHNCRKGLSIIIWRGLSPPPNAIIHPSRTNTWGFKRSLQIGFWVDHHIGSKDQSPSVEVWIFLGWLKSIANFFVLLYVHSCVNTNLSISICFLPPSKWYQSKVEVSKHIEQVQQDVSLVNMLSCVLKERSKLRDNNP
jgi:hypothetical protein